MLLAAAGSATCGRRSCYARPRVDDIIKDFWNPQCCFPIIKVLFGIKAVYLRRVFKIQKKSWFVKRRCTNLRQRPEAKHCSSLCSQSEGRRISWRANTAKNPTKICPKALAMFATCSWPSLCEQSELQCWRRNRRLCGPAHIFDARALLPNYNSFYEHPISHDGEYHSPSSSESSVSVFLPFICSSSSGVYSSS